MTFYEHWMLFLTLFRLFQRLNDTKSCASNEMDFLVIRQVEIILYSINFEFNRIDLFGSHYGKESILIFTCIVSVSPKDALNLLKLIDELEIICRCKRTLFFTVEIICIWFVFFSLDFVRWTMKTGIFVSIASLSFDIILLMNLSGNFSYLHFPLKNVTKCSNIK